LGSWGLFLRKLRARWNAQPTGFIWVQDNTIAASGCPASRGQISWLGAHGINSILTLTEDPLPGDWLEGQHIEARHIPMRDHLPPDRQSLDQAVEFISKQVGSGNVVLVHCLAGRGRTMCALAAYLIKTQGLAPDAALKQLRAIRRGAVERAQEEAVYAYAAGVGAKG
jgi:atypical dual specificity phosphatase